jgi:ubiquinone/menaquinone biosynthesis C-methylase UbiE
MHYLYNLGYKNITGADISDQMIAVAKNKMQGSDNISFIHTEAEHTEFPDDTFDAITSIRFMGHIPKNTRVEILREFNRICKGIIVIEYSVRNASARRIKTWLRRLTVRARLPSQWEWHDVSPNELEDELREAGLQISTQVAKLPFLSESVYVIAKRSEI